jgi:hypothetical protein
MRASSADTIRTHFGHEVVRFNTTTFNNIDPGKHLVSIYWMFLNRLAKLESGPEKAGGGG